MVEVVANIERKEHIKNIIIITVAYLLTHGFILVLTGTWWDEKSLAFASDERLWETHLMMGKPITYFLMKFIFDIPEYIARLVIISCFYIGTLGIYYIFNNLPFIPAQYALWITLIYNAVPVNDARAMRGVFPYTFGYMMFILAFCALVILQTKYEYKNVPFRLLVLLLFTCSFILNSNLVFYGLAILYISYYAYWNGEFKKIYKYADFIIIPILYFGLKTHFFPAYGTYEGYNAVSLGGLIKGGYLTFIICYRALIESVQMWFHLKSFYGALFTVFGVVILFFVLRQYKKTREYLDIKFTNNIVIIFIIGLWAMYLGAYPYGVIGQLLGIVGEGGRSAILLGIGLSMVIFALISCFSLCKIRNILYIVCVLCGIIHFNMYYLMYQQDYYKQQDLIYEMKANRGILVENKNIFYKASNYDTQLTLDRFYTLNSNGREAFGDESHFFIVSKNDFMYLTENGKYYMQQFVYGGDYQMADYNINGSKEIDAVIVYNNDLNLKKTICLKYDELFNQARFEERLFGATNLVIYTPDRPEFDELVSTIVDQ